jgi:hypothetical protein
MTKLALGHVFIVVAAGALGGAACTDDPGTTTMLLSAAQCDAADAWTEWTPYPMGAAVTSRGTHYVCVQSHTSQPDWTPDAVRALWAPAD